MSDELSGGELISAEEPIIHLTENGIEGFEILCRLCANSSDHLISIYSEEGVTNDLAEKMNLYLPVKVHKTDILPLQCCFQCASTVLAWHELVVASVEADRRLRDIQFEVEKQLAGDELPQEVTEPSTSQTDEVEQNGQQEPECTDPLKKQSKPQHLHKSGSLTSANTSTKRKTTTKKGANVSKTNSKTTKTEFIVVLNKIKGTESNINSETCSQTTSDLHKINKISKIINIISSKTTEINNTSKTTSENSETKKKTHKCHECQKTFIQKPSLIRHLRIHRNERPYTCHVCGKGFRDQSGLNRHIRHVHIRVKSFACDICNNSFASAATRDDHRRRHTKERPFVCQECGKRFGAKASLFIHAKTHNDVFPFACCVCAKRFRRRQELIVHSSTHTGQKSYQCEDCGRTFRIRSLLVSHRLVHTDLKPFVCEICGVRYKQLRYLKSHENLKHCDKL